MALRPISAPLGPRRTPRRHDHPTPVLARRHTRRPCRDGARRRARRRCRSGAAGGRRGDPIDDAAPAWSPDGKTIAFASRTEPDSGPTPWQIYTVKATGGARRALTHGSLDSVDLAWSPDGKKIAFSRVAGGQVISSGHVYVMNATGGSLKRVSSGGGGYDELFDWSPDGTMLAFDRITDGVGSIFTMNAGGSNLHELTPEPERRRLLGRLVARRQEDRLRPHRPERVRRHLGDERRRLEAEAADDEPRQRLRLGLVARRPPDRLHVEPHRPVPDLRHAGRRRPADAADPLDDGRRASRTGRPTAPRSSSSSRSAGTTRSSSRTRTARGSTS